MPAKPLTSTERLCVHTMTTKPMPLEDVLRAYPAAGVKGITVWRQALEGRDPRQAGQQLRDAGLEIVSLCRGGFFPGASNDARQKALDDNRKALDEAAELGAPLVVLVCGAVPGQPLEESRKQIRDGIAAVHDYAVERNVRLGIEPLHPMYAADRSAVNTLRQANDMCQALALSHVGVAVDVYHLWWDPELEAEIARCGREGWLWAFHTCDWKPDTQDLLLDRGLMGEGCINLREIRGWVEAAGFGGMIEVEIFSNRWWATDQRAFLEQIRAAYLEHA